MNSSKPSEATIAGLCRSDDLSATPSLQGQESGVDGAIPGKGNRRITRHPRKETKAPASVTIKGKGEDEVRRSSRKKCWLL